MPVQYRRSKSLGAGTRLNVSKSGLSVSKRVGPLTLNSRGRGSLRIAPGFSYRFGRRNNGSGALVMLAIAIVVMLAALVLFALRIMFVVGFWLLRWAWFGLMALTERRRARGSLPPAHDGFPGSGPGAIPEGGDEQSLGKMDALTLHAGAMVSVVGESYRQQTLSQVARNATGPEPYLEDLKGRAMAQARKARQDRVWFQAALLREPNNQYDPNAIAVHATGVGLIGYLDRQAALDYRPVFDELARQGYAVGACPAYLTGGGDARSWGAVLCLSSPEAVVGDLRASAARP
jgi:hypothetical protein